MKKKILILAICTLLITLVLPTSIADEEPIATTEDDVEISITAGWRGKDFGLGVTIDMLNHKTENVTVFFNLTLDYIIPNFLDTASIFNYTLIPDLPVYYHHGLIPCYPDGIKFVSITVEAENTIVTRKGFSIRNFIILFNENPAAERNIAEGTCSVENWDGEPIFIDLSQSSSDAIFGMDVTIPEKPVLVITEINGGFGTEATIKNIGNASATNIYWGMYLEGGHVVWGKKNGFVSSLNPDESTTIRMLRIFGIGKTTITITADCAEGVSVNGSASGTLLLFFLLGL